MPLLKVSGRSSPHAVAGAIAGEVREQGSTLVQVVGAGALNQAMKAIVIARGFFRDGEVDLVCVPAFTEIDIDGDERTAMLLSVEPRVPANTLTLDLQDPEPAS